MNNIGNLLVIARKFNDVFYAVSTSEWQRSDRRVLAIFAGREFAEQFPLQEEFDDVIVFDSGDSRLSNIGTIRKIRRVRKRIRCDAVMLSNIVLVVNQYLMKMSECRHVFLLEDGLMNYYDFRPSFRRIKYLTQLLLGINEQKLFGRISKTFLLAPDMARYYGGNLIQLRLSSTILRNRVRSDIEGKKIFVGQCLYRFGYMSLETYNERVNRIVKKYCIDYYLPHAFALDGEQIDCPIFDLGKLHTTLEVLALQSDFVLYSFCSSVLYTTRIVNANVESYLVRIPELLEKSDLPVIKKYCSGIIDF